MLLLKIFQWLLIAIKIQTSNLEQALLTSTCLSSVYSSHNNLFSGLRCATCHAWSHLRTFACTDPLPGMHPLLGVPSCPPAHMETCRCPFTAVPVIGGATGI